jgi:predicted small secreted protein
MNWKSFYLGAAVGIVGGYVTKEILTQKTNISPERVLGAVKKNLQPKGQILGSWIHMEAEPYDKNQMTYRVYKGGISQNTDGDIQQYEFIADAQTGTLLDLTPFSS